MTHLNQHWGCQPIVFKSCFSALNLCVTKVWQGIIQRSLGQVYWEVLYQSQGECQNIQWRDGHL